MPKTVLALHTGFVLVEPLRNLFGELLADMRLVNLVDDSLLADVRAAGCVTPSVTRRILCYGVLAQTAGADAIFNCCSSVGEAADLLRQTIEIPVVKIDDRLAETAVSIGDRVGIVALATTLNPTARLIERKAARANKKVAVRQCLVEGAFDVLVSGDGETHDQMVMAGIERAALENDVVVLAQGSMARLAARLENKSSVPVLSSPRSGVAALRQILSQG